MDRVGIMLSALCVVHCLLLPLLLAILPFFVVASLPDWLRNTEWVHISLLIPVVLVSGPVLARATGRATWIGPTAALAFVALVAALFVPEGWHEIGLTLTGATLLLVSHIANLKCRAKA